MSNAILVEKSGWGPKLTTCCKAPMASSAGAFFLRGVRTDTVRHNAADSCIAVNQDHELVGRSGRDVLLEAVLQVLDFSRRSSRMWRVSRHDNCLEERSLNTDTEKGAFTRTPRSQG